MNKQPVTEYIIELSKPKSKYPRELIESIKENLLPNLNSAPSDNSQGTANSSVEAS
jgi:hypothetical protein